MKGRCWLPVLFVMGWQWLIVLTITAAEHVPLSHLLDNLIGSAVILAGWPVFHGVFIGNHEPVSDCCRAELRTKVIWRGPDADGYFCAACGKNCERIFERGIF